MLPQATKKPPINSAAHTNWTGLYDICRRNSVATGDRPEGHASFCEHASQVLSEIRRRRCVTVNTYGLCPHRNLTAVASPHETVLNHVQHLPDRLFNVMNQRIGLRARRQLAIRLVAPVGKRFAGALQANFFGSCEGTLPGARYCTHPHH